MRYTVLQKALGQTPLEAIDSWRLENPQYQNVPATYAGRLDPMATGRLLVLLGVECKKQAEYRGLDKEYVIEVLLDVSTDTGDILGMPLYNKTETHPSRNEILRALKSVLGTATVPYPAFSSKTVNGKSLFLYSLEGTLDTITIPTHEETLYRIRCEGIESIDAQTLSDRVEAILSKAPRSNELSKELGADFRQDAIRGAWQTTLSRMENRSFSLLTLRVTCASGTYMRTLANRIGEALDTQGVAVSIHRTKIGTYTNLLGIGFWNRLF